MKNKLSLGLFAVSALLLSATAQAQDYEYHPALSDNFHASVGWFRSDNTFKIEVNGIETETRQAVTLY